MLKNLFLKTVLFIFLLSTTLLFAQKEKDREANIDAVVLNKAKKEYKNKKENPAFAIMQEVWKRKRC
jgi:hypothetical protein